MAEVVASHYPAYKWDRDFAENVWMCTNLECNFGSDHFSKAMEHVAEVLAANGYGKLPETITEWGTARPECEWDIHKNQSEDSARWREQNRDEIVFKRTAPGPWERA